MQQTQTSGNSSSTSTVTTKVSSEHAVAVPVSAAANALVGSKEQQFSTTAASTTAQVITVVAPSHTTQAHGISWSNFAWIKQIVSHLDNTSISGQPVVVQVSSGGQFIAVAVSPESTGQASNTQHSGKSLPDLIFSINCLLSQKLWLLVPLQLPPTKTTDNQVSTTSQLLLIQTEAILPLCMSTGVTSIQHSFVILQDLLHHRFVRNGYGLLQFECKYWH